MIIFTKEYEITTALTNIIICITSIYCLLKTNNKQWKLFFILMSIDSFLGAIAHGIVLNNIIYYYNNYSIKYIYE